MTSSAEETQDELVRETRRAFEFVAVRLDAPVKEGERSGKTLVAYTAAPLSFEVELDWREQAVFLLVCRTVDGSRPGGYYLDDGLPVRVYLEDALSRLGLTDADERLRLRDTRGRRGPDQMSRQVSALAAALRSHLDALVERARELFPPA